MTYVFDTLGYSKHLRHAGVAMAEADAHAEAARDFIMSEIATRDFIMSEIATRQDMLAVRQDLSVAKDELRGRIDTVGLRVIVQLGLLVAASVATLAVLIKL